MSSADAAGSLAERVAALRARVLDEGARDGRDRQREAPGAELFDAIVRLLEPTSGPAEPTLDPLRAIDDALKAALKRRLAWGDDERAILGDAAAVSQRVLDTARPNLAGPAEEIELGVAVSEAGAAVGRIMTLALARRVARDRAAQVREELADRRLGEALTRQRHEIAELTTLLQRRGG